MNLYLKGLKEAIIPAILVVVLPTALLGFVLSQANIMLFIIRALPLVILVDISANIINNYADWDIDIVNKKREVLHVAFRRQDLLLIYILILLLIAGILIFSGANVYLWIATFVFVVLGILYSILIKLKDVAFLNYAAIAIAYAGLSTALGYFSGSSNLAGFESWGPVIIFLILVDFGYSITKDYSDVLGDRMHNKNTLPVVLGKNNSLKVQAVIVTIAYVYLLWLIISGHLNLIYLSLLVSYGFAMYIIFRVYDTAEREIHQDMHHHSQRNGLLVRLIIICILLLI